MDNELYNLCKQVYEATGWDESFLKVISTNEGIFDLNARDYLKQSGYAPLYTSDYLLEKLPVYREYWNDGNEAGYLKIKKGNGYSEAGYWEDNSPEKWSNQSKLTGGLEKTPLKALLKLVLKLHKEKLL